MAKKAELLAEAKTRGISVSNKNTIAEIESELQKHPESSIDIKKDETAKATAKAGKRSAKSLKEAAEKEQKEARKATDVSHENDVSSKNKSQSLVVTRSKLERRSKKYKQLSKKIDTTTEYTLADALKLVKEVSTTRFDGSVELHIRLGVDPKQADQNIRGTVVLPAGTGKKVSVAVFGDEDDVAKAKKAGADIAGGDDFLAKLDKGELNFDILISTPKAMAKLGKYARILGPKGLMPNPKSGTVSTNIDKAVGEAKAGKIEYRVDSTGIIHLSIGKTSFSDEALTQNTKAVFSAVKASKPASLKGNYVQSIYVAPTMGPSIKIQSSEL